MTYTTNYSLSKPESTDTQSSFISEYCNNMDTIDANMGSGGTTYTMSISDHTLTLTDGDGNVQSVSLPDDDTTYTMAVSGTTLTLTDSAGNVQTVTLQDTTYTAGDGIDITSNVISSAYFAVDSDGYLCQIYDDGN